MQSADRLRAAGATEAEVGLWGRMPGFAGMDVASVREWLDERRAAHGTPHSGEPPIPFLSDAQREYLDRDPLAVRAEQADLVSESSVGEDGDGAAPVAAKTPAPVAE